jgi:hypothetical protein
MKLKFNPEAKVTEIMEGPLYLKNEGQPVDVTQDQAEALLRKHHTAFNAKGEAVLLPVFLVADDQGKVSKEARTTFFATYPEGFPHADLLAEAGLDIESTKLLSKEDLTKLPGIGAKSAEAIATYLTEK